MPVGRLGAAEEIAHEVGRRLDWDVLGKKLLDEMAQKYNLERGKIDFVDEHKASWIVEVFGKWLDNRIVTPTEYVSRLGKLVLLAAHHGSRRELLVDTGPIDDREVGDRAERTFDLLTERADGRALVAADERRRLEPVPPIATELVDRQPGDRLEPREEHPAFFAPVPICDLVVALLGGSGGVGHRPSLHHSDGAVTRLGQPPRSGRIGG